MLSKSRIYQNPVKHQHGKIFDFVATQVKPKQAMNTTIIFSVDIVYKRLLSDTSTSLGF